MLAGAVGCLQDLPAAQAADNPLLWLLRRAFGAGGTSVVLAVVGVSIFACALASMAATSRLLFALGRDRMLPGSRWLARVAVGQQTPRNAILFLWATSSLVVVALPNLEVITQISAVAGYLGYAGILIAALRAPPADGTTGHGFSLGRWRGWIAGAALLWVLGVVAALTVPPTELPGIRTRHLPALSTAVAVGVGGGLYLGVIRGRLRRGEAGPPAPPSPRAP
jgi:amino acid transporter